jgi:hypothetical protein
MDTTGVGILRDSFDGISQNPEPIFFEPKIKFRPRKFTRSQKILTKFDIRFQV